MGGTVLGAHLLAITDPAWRRFLATRPRLDELNFRQPGGSRVFKALSPGEPFLFKLHNDIEREAQ